MAKVATEEKETVDLEHSWKGVLQEWIKTLIYAVILALFIRTFFVATFHIPTGSMEPTLRGAEHYGTGDRIIAIKFLYGFRIPFTNKKFLAMTEPKRGDIIVFRTEGIPGLDRRKDLIKRVVGLGGERLQISPDRSSANPWRGGGLSGGHIFIDGERLEEPPTIAERTYYPAGDYGNGVVDIPPDHYYMLGDNASNSRDSRVWGFVPEDNVIGKAVAIYWPPKRIGRVR